ncbi:Fic family protein [Halovivax cerinus]|uniref:Fic family protein n=1 Tax=Halovivax cerinus TaxID=1487865 RepID=A0ABD5NRP2_9EURY|nr:Fic family protein [Halovivax cerinus]
MRPEDFADEPPGDVEMIDGIFAFSPDPLPPELEPTHDLGTEIGDAMYALGQLSDLDTWLDSPEVILSPLVHREAVDSSNIETTTRLTLSDLYRREAGEEPGRTETERADITEAQNYVEAITAGIRALRTGADLDRELLCRLHEILLQGARGEAKNPGELRDDLVGIDEPGTPLSDARFVPAPPASVPYALRGLLQYVRSGPTYAPLVDLALIHYQFETIHPFQDGNGRLGRLLVMLVLYEWDLLPGPYLYPSSYFNVNRDAYLDRLLAVSRDGAWTEWVVFFLRAISEQGHEAYTVARKLLALRDRYWDQYQGQGTVIREVLDFVIEHPYLTEPQAVAALDRSQPAINQAIHRLWDDGVLRETTGQQRHRRYEAPAVLEIVEPYNP